MDIPGGVRRGSWSFRLSAHFCIYDQYESDVEFYEVFGNDNHLKDVSIFERAGGFSWEKKPSA